MGLPRELTGFASLFILVLDVTLYSFICTSNLFLEYSCTTRINLETIAILTGATHSSRWDLRETQPPYPLASNRGHQVTEYWKGSRTSRRDGELDSSGVPQHKLNVRARGTCLPRGWRTGSRDTRTFLCCLSRLRPFQFHCK